MPQGDVAPMTICSSFIEDPRPRHAEGGTRRGMLPQEVLTSPFGCSPSHPGMATENCAARPQSVTAAASFCRTTLHRRAILAALLRTCAQQGTIVIMLQKPYGKLNQPQKTTLSSRYLIKYYRHRLTSLAQYLLFHLSLEKLQAL